MGVLKQYFYLSVYFTLNENMESIKGTKIHSGWLGCTKAKFGKVGCEGCPYSSWKIGKFEHKYVQNKMPLKNDVNYIADCLVKGVIGNKLLSLYTPMAGILW